MGDVQETRKRSAFYERIQDLAFQGHPPASYLRASVKLLIAGFLGVAVGWVMQPFFALVFGIPYWWAYWPAVMVGFIVNLRAQVKMKNLNVQQKS